MLNSLKTMLGFSLLALIGVWMGCSSKTSPVASYSASKTNKAAHSQAGPLTNPTAPRFLKGWGAIDFPDPSLKAAVRAALVSKLGLSAGVAPSFLAENLFKLTKIDASGQGIQNLRGLEYAVYLDTLNLADNSITGIYYLPEIDAPIDWNRASLTKLKYLNLMTNEIADIDSLGRLTKLEYLNLADNSITGIDSLASLTKLTTLYLADNSITDLSPLADLTNLATLYLSSNSITGISDLAGLTELTTLYLADNSITDLGPLASLTKLKRLAIGGNPFRGDLSPLEGLTELEWLMVNSAGVTDLSPLEGLTKLIYLDISASPGITDFSPLVCLLPTLNTLALRGMPLFRVEDGENVPKQDQTDLLYLAAKGVTINFQ